MISMTCLFERSPANCNLEVPYMWELQNNARFKIKAGIRKGNAPLPMHMMQVLSCS